MRLGVFGGTFDPIHLGHLAAAEEAAYRLDLDPVLFVPAHHQPLKEQAPRVSDADRLAMVALAIEGNPRFAVSTVELERPAPSYTVETLRRLRQTYGDAARGCELYFLLGIDSANTLDRWREPAALLRLARLVVMSRGKVPEPDWRLLQRIDPALPIRERVVTLAVPDVDVSARELRRRIAAGEPVRYQLPEPVRAYIERRRLYE